MKVPKRSAGILALRQTGTALEYFLVHPGGPFYRNKNEGFWTIPKGLLENSDANPLATAKRELTEETGFAAPPGPYVTIGWVQQASGKRVDAWAVRADFEPSALVSNEFELEWPPRSGRRRGFPEVDRGSWFDFDTGSRMILPAQAPLLERARRREVLDVLGIVDEQPR